MTCFARTISCFFPEIALISEVGDEASVVLPASSTESGDPEVLLFVEVAEAFGGPGSRSDRTSALLRYLPKTSNSLPLGDLDAAELGTVVSLFDCEEP